MVGRFFENIRQSLNLIDEIYSVRAQIVIASSLNPDSSVKRDAENAAINTIWNERGVWTRIPEGVGRVTFDNGITIQRPDGDNESASWTLSDLNHFFRKKYQGWNDVEVRPRK